MSCVNGKISNEACIFCSLAEVNALSSDDGPRRWVPVLDSVIPITICRKQIEEEEVFLVSAFTDSKTVFTIEFNLKEIRLKKTSECFVQWRNKRTKKAWGLNFISGDEAQNFVDFCCAARVRSLSASSSTASPASTVASILPSHVEAHTPAVEKPTTPIEKHSMPPVIQINDREYAGSPMLPRRGSGSSRDERYNSNNTLVAIETSSGSASRNSTPVDELMNGKIEHTNGDSGYDMDDAGSEFSGITSVSELQEKLSEVNSNYSELQNSLGTSDLGQSVGSNSRSGTSAKSSSDFDETEYSYFQEMQRMHQSAGMNISASFQEDNEHNSSYGTEANAKPESGVAITRQGGATRKAGWLSAKCVLTRVKSSKVEAASDRKWRKYWVTLKNGALNLHHCNEKNVSTQDLDDPTFTMEIDGCIAQAVPEHAKFDHVFSISTRLGDAYYLQATNQTDLENWITAIHSSAATLMATGRPGVRGKGEMVQALASEITRVENKIQSDSKLKKMAELQSTVVTDVKNKQAFVEQISSWERNLEQLNIELYRLQCYYAAVRGSPLPNPQTLLACASRSTKQGLSKMGIFSVMSFHAVISARDRTTEEEVKTRNKAKRTKSSVGYGKLKSALLTSLRINDAASVKSIRDRYSPRSTPGPKRSTLEKIPDSSEESETHSLTSSYSEWKSLGNFLRVDLPSSQSTVVPLVEDMTISDVVASTCKKRQLEPEAYFMKLGLEDNSGNIDYIIPRQDSHLEDHNYTSLSLCQKCVYTVDLTRSQEAGGLGFGLTVTSKNGVILISGVEEGRLAHVQGVLVGDEIVAVNDIDVGKVDSPVEDLKDALEDAAISLKLRSCRDEPPEVGKVTSDTIISNLVVRPPPKVSETIEEGDLSELIVMPPPVWDDNLSDISTPPPPPDTPAPPTLDTSNTSVDELLQSAEQVTLICRQQTLENSEENGRPVVQMNEAQKLRKVILELVDTEKAYVKDLKLLLKRYLDPLKDEVFMTQAESEALVGTVHDILKFQINFLQGLQKLLTSETGFDEFDSIPQFQNVIYTLGETFLEYTDNFKLYSAFCSSHSRMVELLRPGTNEALQEFLLARNPKNQHSGTLESYLIKPIQRILRYPLLLRTMLKRLDKESEEYKCLLEAIVAVEKVATHINEMQRITEQFSEVFHELVEEAHGFEVSDVTIDHLLHHGKATWLNCPDDSKSGTLKRNPMSPRVNKKVAQTTMRIFVFEKVAILLHIDRKSKKKDKEKIGSLKMTDELKFKALIPVTSLVLRDHCWANDDTLHSWELVNISDSAEFGRQECCYLFANNTAEEKRELVRSLKESIKRGIKARSNATGLSAAAPGRSRSFRRNNNSGSGPAFLRASTGDSVLRRSFSHNPEEAQTRRNSLIQGDLIPGGVASAYQEGRENKTSGPLPSPPSQGQQLTAKRKANFMAPVTVGDMGSF